MKKKVYCKNCKHQGSLGWNYDRQCKIKPRRGEPYMVYFGRKYSYSDKKNSNHNCLDFKPSWNYRFWKWLRKKFF